MKGNHLVGLALFVSGCLDLFLSYRLMPRIQNEARRRQVRRKLLISALVLWALAAAFFYGIFPLG